MQNGNFRSSETGRNTRRYGLSKIIAVSILAVVLIAAVLGVLLELNLTGNSKKGSPFIDSEQFLNDTYFGDLLNHSQAASPVGIASYGIYNYSGSLRAYSINSTEVVGRANISALSASTTWNSSLEPNYAILACIVCATLQMNVNVVANTISGEQVFWVQNVVAFHNTYAKQAQSAFGLIFNMTTFDSNMTSQSVGNGRIGELDSYGTYAFGSLLNSPIDYTLPLSIVLSTSVRSYQNGIAITMADDPFGNGTKGISASDNYTFGLVNIPIRNVTSASIVVTTSPYPWRLNGAFSTFDSELDWTAFCCRQTTKFTEMNSTLSLLYLNSKRQLVSYPSFYTFGNTGETANNLSVIPAQGGARVVIGENNNSFLKN